MSLPVTQAVSCKLITTSVVVRTGAWQMVGLFISSNTGATNVIEIFDAVTSGSNTCIPVLTTTTTGIFYQLPSSGANGLTVRVSGSCNAVLFWSPVN